VGVIPGPDRIIVLKHLETGQAQGRLHRQRPVTEHDLPRDGAEGELRILPA